MADKEYSRRKFIKQNALAGIGATVGMGVCSSLFAGKKLQESTIKVEENEPIIDIHQHIHYSGRRDELLLAHQKAMGITTTILLPSGRPVSSASTHYGFSNGLEAEAYGNDACYKFAQAHPDGYTFGACEVPDVSGANVEIEKYLKLGAKVIGELKFGIECDSKPMQKIYKLAEEYSVPVLMHWQFKKYNYSFERFHKMLKKYPDVNFIGHAQTWWANVDKNHNDQSILYPKTKVTQGGLTDRLLSDYPNMFGDLSAGSGLNFFLRDEEHTKEFLQRHQDKLIYGSDCSDKTGKGSTCQGSQTIAAIRRLSSGKAIERKLLFENAKRIFRL
jgi:predicted TIM-barrel fold metal-dependent hydrolase